MPWVLFVAVGTVWAIFLIPMYLADRDSRSLADGGLDSSSSQPLNNENAITPTVGWAPDHHGYGGNGLSHRDLVLARRRCVVLTLGAVAIATLAGWFVLNNQWMILIHLVADTVFVWYMTMLRRIRTFREDLNALFAEHVDYTPPTRKSLAIKVIQPLKTHPREHAGPVLHQTHGHMPS